MYDREIQSALSYYNFNLPSTVYLHICNTSPQITHIKYDAFTNRFNMTTNENNWNFTVYPNL